MVLELVYPDDERRFAQSTSKQIWNILYKETIAKDILQTKGGEEDEVEDGNLADNDDTDADMDSTNAAPSVEEDSINVTWPVGRDTGNDELNS